MTKMYDCIIIGSGIIGTTSALILSRLGLHILVVEANTHPRFAIGESFVPTTTLGFDYLANTYNIPELRQISHYPELRELGCAGWPKQEFWFGHHCEKSAIEPSREFMFVGPGLPLGPDVHVLRSDVDSFLVSRLSDYGVDYQDRTLVSRFIPDESGISLTLNQNGAVRELRARFALDCSGSQSFLGTKFGIRRGPSQLHTNTRTIFSHFQDVLFLDDILDRSVHFPMCRDAGTVHHCFEGGWFWIIRFDNGIASVGLVLDRRFYPDNEQKPEDEFWSFVRRFPTLQAQLSKASAVRPYVKTSRIQFSRQTLVGERYLLAPHAASFVDPLFSTGVDLSAAFITRVVPIIDRMMREDCFRPEHLEAIVQWHHAEIEAIDKIVHGTYCSFRHIDIAKQYWRCWIYISLVQYFTQLMYEPVVDFEPIGHYSGSFPSWHTLLNQMHHCVSTPNKKSSVDVALSLKTIMDNVAEPFMKKEQWTMGSTESCCPLFAQPNEAIEWFQRLMSQEPTLTAQVKRERLEVIQKRLVVTRLELARRYKQSKQENTAYSEGVDFIRSQRY